jgi:four helix bundle protein
MGYYGFNGFNGFTGSAGSQGSKVQRVLAFGACSTTDPGMLRAELGCAMARRLEDLTVYQLSSELRNLVIELSATGGLSKDWRLRDQIRAAASSVPANIAEGFGRFRPREFARSLRYANGSLKEVLAHTADATARGYWNAEQAAAVQKLCRRTGTALARLITYLDSCNPTGQGRS